MKLGPDERINFSHRCYGFVLLSPHFIFSINIENTIFYARPRKDPRFLSNSLLVIYITVSADFKHCPLDT